MTEATKVEGFDVKIRKEGDTYTVTVPALPGCVSDGKSREEAIRNVKGAIADYLSTVAGGLRKPRAKSKTAGKGNGEVKTGERKKRRV